jgi:oxaloacetate decarboxylase alpha subunit
VRAGFQVVHTASGPLSRGTSQPEVATTVHNLEAAGFAVGVDLDAQEEVAAHFASIAARDGRAVGTAQEFDAAYYRHQLPGGMVTTTQRMLEEIGRGELFGAVLDEVPRVRAEMGYPIIVTPVSQLIATQATQNVLDSERWSTVSDETVRYFLGHYGDPPAPVDPDVAERVLGRPQARKLKGLEPISLDGARERFGAGISDEELLLRLTMPAEQVDAMLSARNSAGPASHKPPAPAASQPMQAHAPIVTLLRELAERPAISSLTISRGDDRLVWRRAG